MDKSICSFRPGVAGLIPDAWIIHPRAAPMRAPVVAVHGITRGAEETARLLSARTCATGRILVVPHFDRQSWPRYQRAACDRRADWALLRLMAALRAEGRIGAGRFDLSGFSGGGQFAHRFTWLYPDIVGRLCATAPGWWTFPDPNAAWPYGMGLCGDAAQTFRLRANLRRFVDRPIVVSVGSDDVDRDANLRKGPEIDAQQGATRLERARRWCAAIKATARTHGVAPQITLRVLQGQRHSFADCVTHGRIDRDFVPPAPTHTASANRAHPSDTALERTAA